MRQVDHALAVDVSMELEGDVFPVGRLAWRSGERRAYFEYDGAALERRFSLSPFLLPLQPGAQAAPHSPFDGLHGLFNDSLPDGWGRKLVDRRLTATGYDFTTLSPLDRLTFVGQGGMGALRYRPLGLLEDLAAADIDLDWMAAQAELIEANAPDADVDRLLAAQGGSGGARPKVVVGLHPDTELLVEDRNGNLPDGYEAWLLKFRSADDHAEIAVEEYAYSLMARAAAVDMPETRLLRGSSARPYFAVKRFDRTPEGSLHVHTLSGLLNADYRAPEVDYSALLKVTRLLTRDQRQVERMFRRMVFNVLARNRDDHAKNHAFQMDARGNWSATPAYDLTFSIGPGGEHNMAVAGEGRNPQRVHIDREAEAAGIDKKRAGAIYDDVRTAIGEWPRFAAEAGLSEGRTTEVNRLLNDA